MIKIDDCIFDDVKFNYNDEEKSCVCDCGNSWVPLSANDFKCKECKGAENERANTTRNR